MTIFLAAAEWGGEFDGIFDDINALFEFPYLVSFDVFGLEMGINRTILIAWVMTAVVAALFLIGLRNPTVVPGKFQAALEAVVDLNRTIAMEMIGPKGLRFVPVLTTFMVAIFALNLAKITPFMMLPPTGRVAWPLFFALIAWAIYIGVGIKEQGFGHYFGGIAFPSGVPKGLYIILTPIELVSTLILRPFTLGVRLFANMAAGHILVVITMVVPWVFLPSFPVGWMLGVVGVALGPLVFAFELFIIALQAYIFTMLTAVYIASSMEAH